MFDDGTLRRAVTVAIAELKRQSDVFRNWVATDSQYVQIDGSF